MGEHNPNQPTIFNIFLDDRSSGHFQSLLQPDGSSEEMMQDWYDRNVNIEQEIYKPKLQISVGKLEDARSNRQPAEKKDKKNEKINLNTAKERRKSNDKKIEENIKIRSEKPKPEETNPQKETRKSTYAEIVKRSKSIKENKNIEKPKENIKQDYVEMSNKENISKKEKILINNKKEISEKS